MNCALCNELFGGMEPGGASFVPGSPKQRGSVPGQSAVEAKKIFAGKPYPALPRREMKPEYMAYNEISVERGGR
jgi:hypothetical protein